MIDAHKYKMAENKYIKGNRAEQRERGAWEVQHLRSGIDSSFSAGIGSSKSFGTRYIYKKTNNPLSLVFSSDVYLQL